MNYSKSSLATRNLRTSISRYSTVAFILIGLVVSVMLYQAGREVALMFEPALQSNAAPALVVPAANTTVPSQSNTAATSAPPPVQTGSTVVQQTQQPATQAAKTPAPKAKTAGS